MERNSLNEAWKSWWDVDQPIKLRNIPLLICSGIWVTRNQIIFWEIHKPRAIIGSQSKAIHSMIQEDEYYRGLDISTQNI